MVILKPDKDKAIRNRHHWIFSGAIQSLSPFLDGECVPVYNSKKELLGHGYFNRQAKIIGRMVSFGNEEPYQAIKNAIHSAIALRKMLSKDKQTNAWRVINGEGDCLPGLIVDKYADVLVLQVSTLGMQKLLPFVLEILQKEFSPAAIYEKSLLPSRQEEGLKDVQQILFGELPSVLEITENGLRFAVSIPSGQKTGFFLDHREMRQKVRSLAVGRKVLNCFSYTGGFSVYAAAGKALSVTSVDISKQAIDFCEKNMRLNCLDTPHEAIAEDVFKFLRERPLDYNLIILDPPAFAKRKNDIVAACRGYKDINRIALQKMPKNSLLLTSSCSYHVDEKLFTTVVFQAAVEANRKVKISSRHEMASDHPINICHPESEYLKSLLLYVE